MTDTTSEQLPEPDCLQGFPHPRRTNTLFGHARHEQALAALFASGRMHNSWLVCGPEGIGKATLAYRFAKFALAPNHERGDIGKGLIVREDGKTAAQVEALSHPGLLVLRRPYDQKSKRFLTRITVDEVRRLRGFLRHHSNDNGWRIVIIDRADEMNANAANAILKSLEEPPERTVFFLVTPEPGRLPITIRSRCRTLRLEPLSADELCSAGHQAMKASGLDVPDERELSDLVNHADGSVRRLLFLSTERGRQTYDMVVSFLKNAANPNWRDVHQKVDAIVSATAIDQFESFYGMLLGEVARLAHARALGTDPNNNLTLPQQVIGDCPPSSWVNLWEELLHKKSQADVLQLDRKTLILEALRCLEITARGRRG